MTYLSKSPWILHYDATSCNGCDIEVLASLTPMYDVERFGIINTGNPKHADIFVITCIKTLTVFLVILFHYLTGLL